MQRSSRGSAVQGLGAILMKVSVRTHPFDSIYRHGYVRVATAVPRVSIADPAQNARRTIALARQASERSAALVVFPELGIAAYTSEDLFRQDALIEATTDAIELVREASEPLQPLLVIGAPLRAEQGLFNCAIVIHRGRILGAAPKSYLPEYREFYEKRQFRAARDLISEHVTINGEDVPFGNHLIFKATDVPNFALHVEICDGRLERDPAEHLRCAGGCDRAREPLRQQHPGRQVGLSPHALRGALGPAPSAPTSTPLPGPASRPRIWRGTARR